MRSRTDRLYPRPLGPREREALRLVEQRPGITVAELSAHLGVTTNRVWQIVRRLEMGRVRREENR
jgi:DNA-binding MarR family transcriptional regulator